MIARSGRIEQIMGMISLTCSRLAFVLVAVTVFFICIYLTWGRPLSWSGYRLSDSVKGHEANFSWGGNHAVVFTYLTMYPGTIAAKYMKATWGSKNMWGQYDVLCDIVSKHGDDRPSGDMAIVHLRLGDVADDSRRTGEDLWLHGTGPVMFYIKNQSYYENVVGSMKQDHPGISTIVLTGSTIHSGAKDHTPSLEYISLATGFFKSRGYNVIQRIAGHTPDDDFAYMSHAQVYVYGGGGYSRLVGECVERLGGVNLLEWEGQVDCITDCPDA